MDTDQVKPHSEEDNGTFFRKYKLDKGQKAGGTYFTKYVPTGTGAQEGDNQEAESNEKSDLKPGLKESTDHPARGVLSQFPARILYALAGSVALSVALVVFYAPSRPGPSPGVSTSTAIDASAAESDGEYSGKEGEPTSGSAEASVRRAKLPPTPKGSEAPASPSLASLLAYAREFKQRGMIQQAERAYRDILREFPDDPTSREELERIESTRSAEQRDERARASRELGLMKFRRGDYAGAEPDLVAAMDTGRTDTATLYALGMCYLKLRNPPQAMVVLKRCLAASPDYVPALVGLAQAEASMGDRNRAVLRLNRALELGGGAEFSPAKIRAMIASLNPAPPVAPGPARTFAAHAVHRHSFPFTRCRGELTVSNSVIEYRSDKPSHGFRVASANLFPVRLSDNEFKLYVNGKAYTFVLEGKSVEEFQRALGAGSTD